MGQDQDPPREGVDSLEKDRVDQSQQADDFSPSFDQDPLLQAKSAHPAADQVLEQKVRTQSLFPQVKDRQSRFNLQEQIR